MVRYLFCYSILSLFYLTNELRVLMQTHFPHLVVYTKYEPNLDCDVSPMVRDLFCYFHYCILRMNS